MGWTVTGTVPARMRGLTRGMLAALAVLCVGCSGASPPLDSHRDADPRVVLVVVIDTLRPDHLGAYGYGRNTSPFVDAIAVSGLRFESVWAPAPWTVPSVASMWTGLPPSSHGAGLEGPLRNLGTEPPRLLDPALDTLPGELRKHGWRTLLFSANPYLHGTFGEAFDEAYVERVNGGRLVEAALAEVRARPADQPTLIWAQFMDVHQPNEPPPPYFHLFPAGGSARTAKHGDWSHGQQRDLSDPEFLEFRQQRIGAYDGALRYVDQQIRLLYEGLEEHFGVGGILLVLTSDHGEEFWDHAAQQAGRGDDQRGIWGVGHGHTMFEEQLRVPLILSGPGIPTATAACAASLLALPRSILEWAGIAAPPQMAGRSLLSVGGASSDCQHWVRWAEGTAYGLDAWALEVSGLKLIFQSDGSSQLYDLRRDPGESENLAESRPSDVERLRRAGERLREQFRERGGVGGPTLVVDEDLRRELAALGYL